MVEKWVHSKVDDLAELMDERLAALMDEPKAASLDIHWAELKAGLKVVHLGEQMDMLCRTCCQISLPLST